jgi:hypothetical protein
MFALVIFAVVPVPSPCSDRTEHRQLTAPNRPVPANFFGMHIHQVSGIAWPPIPFGALRLWDSHVTWPDLEPVKENWHFEILDRYIELAEKNRVELLLTLGMTPTWASTRPHEPSTHGDGGASEARNLDEWRNYVRTVVNQCKGHIRYYEVWNEPNEKDFYTGDVKHMVQLAQSAYESIKAVDPSAMVISPSVSMPNTGGRWLDDFLQAGGGKYVDIIGVHLYVFPEEPEAMLAQIETVRQILAKHGLQSRPIWNTEAGWSKPKRFDSDEEAEAYVARAYLLNWAAGIDRFYWYAWDNRHWVTLYMISRDGTPTAAAHAYAEVTKWILGARMQSCGEDLDKTWVCSLTRDRNYHAWVLWNPHKTRMFSVPSSWHVRFVTGLEDVQQGASGVTRVKVGPSPVLLQDTQAPTVH